MSSPPLLQKLRSYYRGCRDRDLREFYDLESCLPYFDQVSRILGWHKRHLLLTWIEMKPWGGPILELGGGIGTLARQLARRGNTVVSVDLSPAKTKKARNLTARESNSSQPPVHSIQGDLREIGKGTQADEEIQRALHWDSFRPFEVVIAADVVEHVPDEPERTILHLQKLLAPGGRLYVSVPSKLCLNDPGHLWKLLPKDWEEVFAKTGFIIQRRKMSRICWYGLPTPLPLAMVYELSTEIRIVQS